MPRAPIPPGFSGGSASVLPPPLGVHAGEHPNPGNNVPGPADGPVKQERLLADAKSNNQAGLPPAKPGIRARQRAILAEVLATRSLPLSVPYQGTNPSKQSPLHWAVPGRVPTLASMPLCRSLYRCYMQNATRAASFPSTHSVTTFLGQGGVAKLHPFPTSRSHDSTPSDGGEGNTIVYYKHKI